jgi:hypothetical protein
MNATSPGAVEQLDFFPERVSVERVNTKSTGARSRVTDIYVVRYERERSAHQVFHDRHGWYCAEHGRECRAVPAARGANRD